MISNEALKKWHFDANDPETNSLVKILGVEYAHVQLADGDLYVTADGLPFIETLDPFNYWLDKPWFNSNSRRLRGTSCVYHIKTKRVKNRHLDVVMKWNRMGQDIPGADQLEVLEGAAFNSPFEEFSLVNELRKKLYAGGGRIAVQRPLAIFVASEQVEMRQVGRKPHRMKHMVNNHNEVDLDPHRLYAVVYEWMKGIDAHEAFRNNVISRETMKGLALDAQQMMADVGFQVRDNKPDHVIVRPKSDNHLARNREGQTLYGLIDFELLERTDKGEELVKRLKRKNYLRKQRDRFKIEVDNAYHPHLHHVNYFGVDYIYGHVESVRGRLWVVGRDPDLFDYFLPERWKHFPKTRIATYSEMYHTITKDDIHLVLKASNVGIQPDLDPFKDDEQKLLAYGHNSPFEEAALAVELNNKGVASIYPRAIYMAEHKTEISDYLFDPSRYESHENLRTPDDKPILRKNRDYIIIWGYWNGPDDKLADSDGDYYTSYNALRAYKEQLIDKETYFALLKKIRDKLSAVGVEDLNLRGTHILVTLDSNGRIIQDKDNLPEIRLCSFDFLRTLPVCELKIALK